MSQIKIFLLEDNFRTFYFYYQHRDNLYPLFVNFKNIVNCIFLIEVKPNNLGQSLIAKGEIRGLINCQFYFVSICKSDMNYISSYTMLYTI